MNTDKQTKTGSEDQMLKELFQHVTARKRAPAELEQKIFTALHSEWRQFSRRRAKRWTVTVWAAVASLLTALLLFTILPRQNTPAIQYLSASVEKRSGDVFIQNASGEVSRLVDSGQLLTGLGLFTKQDSGIALRWGSGESLRLDQNSRIKLFSNSEIEILSGRLYVDSGVAKVNGPKLSILTPAGLVSHLGTQYMIGVTASGTDISVREGKVSVGSGKDTAIAGVGQRFFVYSDGRRAVAAIPTFGESWQWTERLAPQFSMDGHSMRDFLAWVGRETGRRIIYSSPAAEVMAREAQLHGSVDLEPLRALEVLLQTSDLVYLLQDEGIVISAPRKI